MNLTLVDWSILGGFLLVVLGVAVYTKRYVLGVADFVAGNRCAGRYLLVGSELMAAISATMFVAKFEQFYQGGFPILWWTGLITLVTLAKGLLGWVQYRFRETRALTMPQFFEMRYNRKFRLFTGILAWLSGIFNFAIHPAITSRLIVYFFGLSATVELFGIELRTVIIVMFFMLSVGVLLALAGGQIALMITDWLQGQLVLIVTLFISMFLITKFGWNEITETLKSAPSGKSLLNPFEQGDVSGFNVWFFIMFAFLQFYHEMAFQGTQGYFGAAKTPHEAKMSKILGIWRQTAPILLCCVCAIIAYTVFHNQNYADKASFIQSALNQLPEKQMQIQMRVPLTLVQVLPVGMMGLLASVFIASSLSTDNTYLHGWGVVFIQDVVIPLRKTKLLPKKQVVFLRLSIVFVACFALVAGILIPIRDYILMYFQITFAIFGAGAGSAIIGGLYWKRGTIQGAWTAMINGALICVLGYTLQAVWPISDFLKNINATCPVNGAQITFFASVTSIILYVIVSLLTCKKPFNMEKLLNRGKYSVNGDHIKVNKKPSFLKRLTGIDTEFTFGDKVISTLATTWVLSWVVIFVFGTIYYYLYGITDDEWCSWWWYVLLVYLAAGLATFIWYLVGGIRDVRNLFHDLKLIKRDDSDDGSVREYDLKIEKNELFVPNEINIKRKSKIK